NDGWTLSSNTCNVNACSGYALSSCPEHGNCGTCKSGTSDKYALNSCQDGYTMNGNTCVANDELVIVYTPDSSKEAGIDFTLNGTITVDWGDGIVETYNGPTVSLDNAATCTNLPDGMTVSHTYGANNRSYRIIMSGSPQGIYQFESKWGSNNDSFKIEKFDLKVKVISYMFYGIANDKLYLDTSKVGFSDTIIGACDTFGGFKNVTGEPKHLPANLKQAMGMFENTRVTGVPTLPSGLINAQQMFKGTLLTGVPTLPNSLVDASEMFAGVQSLTGQIPNLPSNLKNAYGMFINTDVSGTIPSLPSGITLTKKMFKFSQQLSGPCPAKPSNLTDENSCETFDTSMSCSWGKNSCP
ncbi:MAG: hypothetical protein IJ545_01330, partial [Alphaproteobacteria bacterium]|nr:hypothetical protein [Alphaproteobacteria bacterium]